MHSLADLATPVVLLDRARVERNIRDMQTVCDAHGVQLWPHIKTHKMVEVARRQLAAGAQGLTCAKLGEAEAMLPSGVKRIFIAHSLVDERAAPRLAAMADRLDELRVAATSPAHAEALVRLAAVAARRLKVMLAVDTGLGREGARTADEARVMARTLAASPWLELAGFYTHEGQLYSAAPEEQAARSAAVLAQLAVVRDAVDPNLPLWPGCSVTAKLMAASGRAAVVRPGAYIFGDLFLSEVCRVMPADAVALHVLATVVDKPERGLALIDAGSKTFSSDKTPGGLAARAADGRDLAVVRCNEEHGYVRGGDVDALRIGERVRFTPAHVCPVVNLTDEVIVVAGDLAADRWRVDARGRVQ